MPEVCAICGGTAFAEFNGRAAGRCEQCGALERHRALVTSFYALMEDGYGRSCLETGPLNRRIFGGFLRDRGWRYTSIDRWRHGNPVDQRDVSFIDAEVDLSDLSPLGDERFDLFVAQHVIEEIEDPRRALAEVGRVLRPNGIALLEIPFGSAPASARIDEDSFGNRWRFGTDLIGWVEQAIGTVTVVPVECQTYRGTILEARK